MVLIQEQWLTLVIGTSLKCYSSAAGLIPTLGEVTEEKMKGDAFLAHPNLNRVKISHRNN